MTYNDMIQRLGTNHAEGILDLHRAVVEQRRGVSAADGGHAFEDAFTALGKLESGRDNMFNRLRGYGPALWGACRGIQRLVEIPQSPFYLLNVGELEGQGYLLSQSSLSMQGCNQSLMEMTVMDLGSVGCNT